LTARPQAARHDGLDAWRRPKTRFALDADGSGTGEELGANSTDVVDTPTNTSKQGITLTVVCAVMVFDVSVSFLKIAEAEDCVDVGILLEGLKPCDIFRMDCRSPDSWPWSDHPQISLMHSPTPHKCSTRALMTLINNLGSVYHQYCSSSYLDIRADPGS
jgi:hypothetical protein